MSRGIEAATQGRRIQVQSTYNLRDVGGYPIGDIHMTAWGRLYRSDLPGPTSDIRGEVAALGLRTVIDLRSEGERLLRPSMVDAGDSIQVLHRSVGVGIMLNAEPDLGASLSRLYSATLHRLGPEVAAAVSALVEPGVLPALVHCTAGKDRTGLVIALVLSSLGVPDDVVAADFAVTEELLTPEFFAGVDPQHVLPDGQVDLTPLHRADAASMLEALALVREIAGSARGYLVRHGVNPEGLDRLRDEMVVLQP